MQLSHMQSNSAYGTPRAEKAKTKLEEAFRESSTDWWHKSFAAWRHRKETKKKKKNKRVENLNMTGDSQAWSKCPDWSKTYGQKARCDD